MAITFVRRSGFALCETLRQSRRLKFAELFGGKFTTLIRKVDARAAFVSTKLVHGARTLDFFKSNQTVFYFIYAPSYTDATCFWRKT